MEWALQGITHRKKFLSTEADRTALTELSCSSELQQRGNGSLWSSPTHLQPWKSSRRTTPGSWRLPASALAGPNTEPNTNISLELTLSLRVISSRAASPPYRPEDRYLKETPLMSFTPPSAHQVVQVHQRGVPSPLRSVFTVGPVLTVCSLLDPAGLFHPAALLGLRGPWRRIQRCFHSRGPSATSQNTILLSCPSCTRLAARTRGSGLRPVPALLLPEDMN